MGALQAEATRMTPMIASVAATRIAGAGRFSVRKMTVARKSEKNTSRDEIITTVETFSWARAANMRIWPSDTSTAAAITSRSTFRNNPRNMDL